MAKYFASNKLGGTQQNMSSSFKTLLAMFATTAATRRGKLYDVAAIGADGTPADNVLTFNIMHMTADGTGTAVTPNPVDPADVAALSTVKANYTAEPTITANSNQLDVPENQRATYRWAAFPGGEILWPATANNGLAIRATAPNYVGTAIASAYFEEQ